MSDITTSPAFKRTLTALVAASDLEGIKKLRTEIRSKQEAARMRFTKNRSVKNGEIFRRCGVALTEIMGALAKVDMKLKVDSDLAEEAGPLDEAPGAIQNAVGNVMRTARDRALYHGAGNQQARGRLDLGAITQKMLQNWGRYVGHSASTGDKHLKTAPTWDDLIGFLNFAYGIKVDTGVIAGLAKRAETANTKPQQPQAAAPAQDGTPNTADSLTKGLSPWSKDHQPQVSEPKNPKSDADLVRGYRADDKARQALSKTTPQEYAALKKKFGQSPNYPGKKVGESVINELEDDDDNHLNAFPDNGEAEAGEAEQEPGKTVFNPYTLFPILADFLLKKGLVKVKRGKETYGAKNGPDDEDADEDDGEETTNARETPDGHTVDIDRMNKYLSKYKVSSKDLNSLKAIVLKSTAATLADNLASGKLGAGSNVPRTLSVFVFAVLRSVVGKADVDHDKASRSITKDGNVFDINIFMNELQKRKVVGGDLKSLLGQLKGADSGNLIKTVYDTISDPKSRQAQVAFAVAAAGLKAIVKDQKKAPAEEKPAATPAPEAPEDQEAPEGQ